MPTKVIIDVREKDEFNAEYIPESIHVPLAEFQMYAAKIFKDLPPEAPVLIMCRSGKRADIACKHAKALGLSKNREVSAFAGGILEWKKRNFPTEVLKATHFPIMRQVQIIAGSLVMLSVGLGYWVNPAFLTLGGVVGLGLTIAGITGFCGMAFLLGRAPWNQVKTGGRA